MLGNEHTETPTTQPSIGGAAEISVPTDNPGPGVDCPTCNGAATVPASFIYALGRIEPRFPRLSVEKEFTQATGRADTANLSDRQALHRVLSERPNRYLVRQLCWVMLVGGLETYLLYPRDPVDLDQLVDAVRPRPNAADLDLVIGVRGPLASADVCNGLTVPIVIFDQIYSFDRAHLISSIPRPDNQTEAEFAAASEELFDRMMGMADNAGATDEHRALNYLAMRYPQIYAAVTEAHAANSSLSAVDVRPSHLTGLRKVVEVIFSFTNRGTDVVTKQFARVDVTDQFPFLVSKLAPYFDR